MRGATSLTVAARRQGRPRWARPPDATPAGTPVPVKTPSTATSDADEEMAWLDVKGAFLGADGSYQVKSAEERGSRLNKRGTA